jgi:hypothetical protein
LKKSFLTPAFVVLTALALVIAVGCSSGSSNGGSGGDVTGNTLALLAAYTYNSPVSTSMRMRADVASGDSLASTSPREIRFPDGSTYTYSRNSGSVNVDNYYVGTTPINLGAIADPFSETVQRQLNVDVEYAKELAGNYTVTLGNLSKSFSYPISGYMDPISLSDLSLGSGGTIFRISGDSIFISNQNNPNYRYFCRIYNNLVSTQQGDIYQNYWTSADVRTLDWRSAESLSEFILNKTTAPVAGTVRFDVPGGILTAEQAMLIRIWAFDTSAVGSNTTGSFKSFTWAFSELALELQAQ